MTLDFEKYDYELFQDWQENLVKNSFTSELEKRTEEEKSLPKLLSYDHVQLYISVIVYLYKKIEKK